MTRPYFYPRSPCGERLQRGPRPHERRHFYPRSPCGERRRGDLFQCPGTGISIHALLAESDGPLKAGQTYYCEFLSTLSLRRATTSILHKILADWDFYPRSPCGERLVHALKLANPMLFLSTLSLRRATNPKIRLSLSTMISIHALLAESDRSWNSSSGISPRFLSTLSLRRATTRQGLCGRRLGISIHALLAESDITDIDFRIIAKISIHALLAESDTVSFLWVSMGGLFLSTLSLRRATS